MEAFFLNFKLDKKGEAFSDIVYPHLESIFYYVRNLPGHLEDDAMDEPIYTLDDLTPNEVEYHWTIDYDRRLSLVVEITETRIMCIERCGHYCDRSRKLFEMIFTVRLDNKTIYCLDNSDDSKKYKDLCDKIDDYLAMLCSYIEKEVREYNEGILPTEEANLDSESVPSNTNTTIETDNDQEGLTESDDVSVLPTN